MLKSDPPIIVEQYFNSDKAIVWKAITEVEQMRQWFFDNIPDFKVEIGFETSFTVSTGEREFIHLWKIDEVIPEKKIVYNWKYEGFPGDSFVTFELFGEEEGTRIRLSTKVIEDFPQDIPEFKRESGIAGWQYFINEKLKAYLEAGKQGGMKLEIRNRK